MRGRKVTRRRGDLTVRISETIPDVLVMLLLVSMWSVLLYVFTRELVVEIRGRGQDPQVRAEKEKWKAKEFMWAVLIIIGVFAAATFVLGKLITTASPFVKHSYLWVMSVLGLKAIQLFFGITVVVMGCGAFVFKLRFQTTYGVIEVLVAWAVGVIAARQIRPQTDWMGVSAALIGAMYIVSRGLGNIMDGVKAKNTGGSGAQSARVTFTG
jgi:hypothetical protein